jgi:hypothetical protein
MMGMAMVAFIALTVVGIDLGRLAFTATEVQGVADIAATAGCRTLARNSITGATDNPVSQAQAVVSQNKVNGQAASIAAGDVVLGSWDFNAGSFTAGGVPNNAVQANAQTTVNNLVAAAIGSGTTTVQKTAIAAFSGVASNRPVLPLAVGECHFEAFQGSGSCSDLPSLTQAPSNSDNTCWTSLGPSSASASQAKSYLPTTCCHGGSCGGGQDGPHVSVGSSINIMNGQATTLLQIIEDCVKDGMTEFVVPVIECNNCNGAMNVTGFATIKITSVKSSGNPKGIDLTSFCNSDDPGPGGGGNFGTVSVSLVQ